MSVLAWNYQGLWTPPTIRTLTEEVKVKNPILVFLAETKATIDRMKGFQHKLGFTQGIIVPSDGKSGGLAMLWKEGVDVRFKSYSHSHINVVVHSEGSGGPWRTTSFYGHPITSKRQSSRQLIESLYAQCKMLWLVCGDFNEIMHLDEKIGLKERDANQMGEFRESLSKCGLFYLGFVGPRFTWCNGRFGDQRTLLQLDRMVANEECIKIFPEAKVHNVSMLASDHCLLVLLLKHNHYSKRGKKHFFFEEMWTREEECKEVIEMAWDPYKDDSARPIQERLERCQRQLQCWN